MEKQKIKSWLEQLMVHNEESLKSKQSQIDFWEMVELIAAEQIDLHDEVY